MGKRGGGGQSRGGDGGKGRRLPPVKPYRVVGVQRVVDRFRRELRVDG